MKILLVQIDGSLPNIALMRIAHHYRGSEIRLARGPHFQPTLDGWRPDKIYASAIFQKSRPIVDSLLKLYPSAIVGGTGIDGDSHRPLSSIGISTNTPAYFIYPDFTKSIGFTQRGCRLKCKFCVVPGKEGDIAPDSPIHQIWRGPAHPRELILLDNDFFGNPDWPSLIAEIRSGNFKVSFTQGINARFLTPETAEAIASIDYRDDSMKVKRIYTAWDNLHDESRLFRGLHYLTDAGVKPDHIMVYLLIGYWPGETIESCDYRRAKLRDFGARPYPMPFIRTPELVGFQRFVIGAYDKRFSWQQWKANNYRPEGLTRDTPSLF